MTGSAPARTRAAAAEADAPRAAAARSTSAAAGFGHATGCGPLTSRDDATCFTAGGLTLATFTPATSFGFGGVHVCADAGKPSTPSSVATSTADSGNASHRVRRADLAHDAWTPTPQNGEPSLRHSPAADEPHPTVDH